MPAVLEKVQNSTQHHPLTAYAVAASLIIASSGSILHLSGRAIVHTPGLTDFFSLRYYQQSGDHVLTVYNSWPPLVQQLQTSVCNFNDHAAEIILHIGEQTREIRPLFIALADRLTIEARHLLEHPWIARTPITQVLTVLVLAVFLLFIGGFSGF